MENFSWIVWTEICFKTSQLVTNHTLSVSNTSTFTDRSSQLCWMTMQLFLWLHSGQGQKNPYTKWNRRKYCRSPSLKPHSPSLLLFVLKDKVRNLSFKICDLWPTTHTKKYLMDSVSMCTGAILSRRNFIISRKGFVGCFGLPNFFVISLWNISCD